VSPILLRPVREQLEHDRIIRLLYAKARRRFHAAMNPGSERNAPVGSGDDAVYPDLVLGSPERRHRLQVVVEVETGESINTLEALAEWMPLARLPAAFHLYVPAGSVDVARRLCDDHDIVINEIWSYHPIGDQMRFTLVHRTPVVKKVSAKSAKSAKAKEARRPPRRPARQKRRAKPKRGARPAKRKIQRPRAARRGAVRKGGRGRTRR
jgi:hypothetical protein